MRSSQGTGGIKPIKRATNPASRLEDVEAAYNAERQKNLDQGNRHATENLAIQAELASERQKVKDITAEKLHIKQEFDLANERIGQLTAEVHMSVLQRNQLESRHKIAIENEQADAVRKVREVETTIYERDRQIASLHADAEAMKRTLQMDIADKVREMDVASSRINDLESQLESERISKKALEDKLAETCEGSMNLQETVASLRTRIQNLEHQAILAQQTIASKEQSLAESEAEKAQLTADLISEETQRRVLHNQIQELKGNIRVFCRVRPALAHEPEANAIRIPDTPDEVEVISSGAEMSLYGKEDKTYNFGFDKVRSVSARR
jgi:kinesin family protein C1